MGVLTGPAIRSRGIVTPCVDRTVAHGMSYGLSYCGYDIRAAEGPLFIPPGKFQLLSSVELFTMPKTVMGVVHDKSTWARRGLAVQNTVLEPGWTGYLTLEATNHSDKYIKIEAGSPIAQIVFHVLEGPLMGGYTGKYQDQERGAQEARYENGTEQED